MGKKHDIPLFIPILIIIVLIVAGIIFFTNGSKSPKDKDGNYTIASDFENMIPKDISLSYDEETNLTTIKLKIENTTDKEIKNQEVDVMLYNEEGLLTTGVLMYIESIGAKSSVDRDAMLLGDFSDTKRVVLEKTASEETDSEETKTEEK